MSKSKAIVKVEGYGSTITIENISTHPSYDDIIDAISDITGWCVSKCTDMSKWERGSMTLTCVLDDDGELSGNNIVKATAKILL